MRIVDRILQRWRERVARPWISNNARILDIGCHQGEFLSRLGKRIVNSVGIDLLATPARTERYEIRAEAFREPLPLPDESFDCVVLLATLEHMSDKESVARECRRILRPGGRVIITVPSPRVDAIIDWLVRSGVADGMSLEEHHGYKPSATPELFEKSGLELVCHRRFQLGLNNLFVFARPSQGIKY